MTARRNEGAARSQVEGSLPCAGGSPHRSRGTGVRVADEKPDGDLRVRLIRARLDVRMQARPERLAGVPLAEDLSRALARYAHLSGPRPRSPAGNIDRTPARFSWRVA